MKKSKLRANKQIIIVIVLGVMLLGISMAYAVLSSTFNLVFEHTGTNELTWNVGLETGTISATPISSANNIVCGDATITSSTAAIENITLNNLGDKCIYKLKVKNTGGVLATLSAIVAKTPSENACNTTTLGKMTCGNITYKLTSDLDGLAIIGLGNSVPQYTGIMDLYLIAEYTGVDSGVAVNQKSAGFAVIFSQK